MKKSVLLLIILVILPIANVFADAEDYYNKGIALYNLEKFEEAITALDLANKPDYVDAYSYKGIALVELGKFEEAITL
jgi:tetratricopeptide (TPR) repeat protein